MTRGQDEMGCNVRVAGEGGRGGGAPPTARRGADAAPSTRTPGAGGGAARGAPRGGSTCERRRPWTWRSGGLGDGPLWPRGTAPSKKSRLVGRVPPCHGNSFEERIASFVTQSAAEIDATVGFVTLGDRGGWRFLPPGGKSGVRHGRSGVRHSFFGRFWPGLGRPLRVPDLDRHCTPSAIFGVRHSFFGRSWSGVPGVRYGFPIWFGTARQVPFFGYVIPFFGRFWPGVSGDRYGFPIWIGPARHVPFLGSLGTP